MVYCLEVSSPSSAVTLAAPQKKTCGHQTREEARAQRKPDEPAGTAGRLSCNRKKISGVTNTSDSVPVCCACTISIMSPCSPIHANPRRGWTPRIASSEQMDGDFFYAAVALESKLKMHNENRLK